MDEYGEIKMYWFKIVRTNRSKQFAVNSDWTMTEFIEKMKPDLLNFLRTEFSTVDDVDIFDNTTKEQYKQCIVPEDKMVREKYDLQNLAFYVKAT
jgi:hypothetical protein